MSYFMDESGDPKFLHIIGGAIGGLIALIILWGSWGVVEVGSVGVRVRLGAVKGVISQGPYLKIPLIESVTKMDVQVQKEQTSAEAASKDLQTVSTVVAVNYSLEETKVGDLYSRIGENYRSKVIDPSIQEVVKAVTAKYTAEELITKRAIVTDEIKIGLSDRLSTADIKVSGVSIINFDFSKSFNEAIESKVTNEQRALGAKNLLEQKKYEAEQIVVTAQANAEAIKIQAQAVTSQGGADYVKLQWIKAWEAGGAKVPNFITSDKAGGFIMNMNQ